MLGRCQQYVPPVIYLMVAMMLLGYSFEIGRATGHQEERKQVEAAAELRNGANKDKTSQSWSTTESHPPNEPTQVSLLGVRIGEGLLVLVTLMLVAVTYQLVLSGKRSSEKQLRAYVSVEPDGINPYEGRSYLIGHIKIRNRGRVPATNLSVFSNIDRDTDGQTNRLCS